MKKLLILLSLSSCTTVNKVYYPLNIKKCIKNLETLQKWLQQDYENGAIPRYVADNYMLVLQNTKCGLLKKTKGDEKKANCVD